MKRTFADLHLCPNLKDPEHVNCTIEKAHALGYSVIALTFPPNASEKEIEELRKNCTQQGIDLATRVDLKPRSPNELKHDLRRLRRKFEVIAVLCETRNVARQAAKDRRVDLLNFPKPDFRAGFFDEAEAELAANALATFEIDIKQLLTTEGSTRAKLLSILRIQAAMAKAFRIPVVVSSGVSEERLLRKPLELATIASLFNLDYTTALDALSKNPVTIVRRNRSKLEPGFVAPGIRVKRRGKDC